MTTSLCQRIQESIAWGNPLPTEDQHHVLTCTSCGQCALEMEKLDAQVNAAWPETVPLEFVERVMKKVELRTKKNTRWTRPWFALFLANPTPAYRVLRYVIIILALLAPITSHSNVTSF